MKKGVLDMLVLALLMEEEKYGYQIISELKEKSAELLCLKEGTLYPILYRMEDDQLIRAEWSEAKGKEPSRKYYKITKSGIDTFIEMTTIWGTFENIVDDIIKTCKK